MIYSVDVRLVDCLIRIRKMATSRHTTSQSDIRTEFTTIEGVYKNIKTSEHCRPNRQPLYGKELSSVKVSFVSCKDKEGPYEWVLFNSGKELYFYPFEGVGKVPDLKRHIDKRVYKTPTIPVCHDFNLMTKCTTHLDLIVGFSTGPLQYLHPLDKRAVCAFNEDGAIDNTRVTCVKWVPSSETEFVSSHRSGHLYVWSVENTSKTTGIQNYVPHAEIQDAVIHTVKSKHKSPVLYRWSVGHGAINAFDFSPDLTHIAIASQDGFLRVYDFPKQQFYARMRSYYGGLLCVCWSPDGRYSVTGGEDDLITVWSFEHKRVVARGEGHKSYVNDVAFDPYTTCIPDRGFSASERHSICSGSDNGAVVSAATPTSSTLEASSGSHLSRTTSESVIERDQVAYRLGSIGQDTQLCLWDLSGDSLKLRRLFSRSKSRLSRHASRQHSMTDITGSPPPEDKVGQKVEEPTDKSERESSVLGSNPLESEDRSNHVGSTKGMSTSDRTESSLAQNKSTSDSNTSADTEKGTKESTASPESSIQSTGKENSKKLKKANKKAVKLQAQKGLKAPVKKVMKFVGNIGGGSHGYRRDAGGTFFETCNSHDIAPKMDEVNLIEPLVAKVISHERLTALVFRRDCIVTACQEGFVHTWARPNAKLPPEATADYNTESRPQTSTVSSNPGINSPKPGSGGSEVAMKSTTV